MRLFTRSQRHRHADLTLWLDPGPRGCDRTLAEPLADAFDLVVVPRTGSRQADVGVLLDPDPAELDSIRHVLPHTALFVLPSRAPSPALLEAADRDLARVLPVGTSAAQLIPLIRQRTAATATVAAPTPAAGTARRQLIGAA